jgi:hypothetical protein
VDPVAAFLARGGVVRRLAAQETPPRGFAAAPLRGERGNAPAGFQEVMLMGKTAGTETRAGQEWASADLKVGPARRKRGPSREEIAAAVARYRAAGGVIARAPEEPVTRFGRRALVDPLAALEDVIGPESDHQRAQASAPLPALQARILEMLAARGPLNTSALERALGAAPGGAVGYAVSGLKVRGLVARDPYSSHAPWQLTAASPRR